VNGPYLAVVGPGDADEDTCALAAQVGRLIAEAGGVVVCGGLGGVMEEAARGATQSGGISLGILPGASRAEGNPHLTVVVATGLGQARNTVVVGTSDAVIAVGGSWGTMSEVALAVRTGIPVISLGGWTAQDRAGRPVPGITQVTTPSAAVDAAVAAAAAGAAGALGGRPPGGGADR
jgi:uncharacterized protein (TIGR00725 family)